MIMCVLLQQFPIYIFRCFSSVVRKKEKYNHTMFVLNYTSTSSVSIVQDTEGQPFNSTTVCLSHVFPVSLKNALYNW